MLSSPHSLLQQVRLQINVLETVWSCYCLDDDAFQCTSANVPSHQLVVSDLACFSEPRSFVEIDQ